MTRLVYFIIAGIGVASAANAANEPSFAAAAAKSAAKFKTEQGGQYGIAFMKSAGRALVPAAQACKASAAKPGSYHDVVFMVSASGHIRHIIHGQRSAYGDCVTSHLQMPESVAKPPGDSWPIHIRFLHGVQPRGDQPPFMVVSDDATASSARDGSTLERAIIVTEPERSSRQWQLKYLDRHFPGHSAPPKIDVAADAATRRVWEEFSFTWKGQKKSLWFDVTQPFREYAGSTREYREFAKPPPRPR
jgi:hypothetical protein